MATNFEQIKKYLDDTGYKYNEDDDTLIIVANGEWKLYTFIRLREDGEFLSIQTQLNDPNANFLQVSSDCPYKLELMQYLMNENIQYKVGQWGIDEEDGEIRFTTNYHIEDGELTQKQFIRIIKTIFKSADESAVQIDSVMKTGKKKVTDEEAKTAEAEAKSKILAELNKRALALMEEEKYPEAKEILGLVKEVEAGNLENARKVLDELAGSGN